MTGPLARLLDQEGRAVFASNFCSRSSYKGRCRLGALFAGMEGAEGTPLLLDDLEASETLLVYCGDGGEEEAATTEQHHGLPLTATLDLQPSITHDNE